MTSDEKWIGAAKQWNVEWLLKSWDEFEAKGHNHVAVALAGKTPNTNTVTYVVLADKPQSIEDYAKLHDWKSQNYIVVALFGLPNVQHESPLSAKDGYCASITSCCEGIPD